MVTDQLFSPLRWLLSDAGAHVGTFLLFLVLFEGSERVGDRPAYQPWRSKHAGGDQNKRPTIQEPERGRREEGRKEGRKAGRKEGSE